MSKLLYVLILCGICAALFLTPTANVSAAGPQWVVVVPGDTLYAIALRHGTTVWALMRANNLPSANFVYAGQRLIIPTSSATAAPPVAPASPNRAANSVYYTVRAGDTLYQIATRFGTSVQALAQVNNLWSYSAIYTGQQLLIPGANPLAVNRVPTNPPASNSSTAPNGGAPAPIPNAAVRAPTSGKWIDISIRKQTITAYEGTTPLKSVLVSTGVAAHPTVVGTYAVYSKYSAITMSGGTRGVDAYYLPNVPWTMFFYKGYAVHGTYWHKNFGRPMSHGCVNLTIADAKWFFEWAPVGTPVVSHN